jgi:urocanate hydratase
MTFAEEIRLGIPDFLPEPMPYDPNINHAPKRKEILNHEEKQLALRNALRYFPKQLHAQLAPEFIAELDTYGRIYMYRYRPTYDMYARPIDEYPHRSEQAAAIMLMIQNNLNPEVAQHPHELIVYGGNGAIFQNWAQYRLTMKYLSEMTDEQTLVMYSGHPLGLFPSHPNAPRVVVTNGMVIPNYSKPDDWERMNALGVSQYGQMTAGSYMYIGPQGIVHGTTITVLNAARKQRSEKGGPQDIRGMLFVSSGLGGMSGAQPKAGNIAGVVSVVAEINPLAAKKRYDQGWVDELHDNLDELIPAIKRSVEEKRTVSMAYVGNVVDLWERLADEGVHVDIGSDQTSLHNPWAGGYYPADLTLEESKTMMAENPDEFRKHVQASLCRQVAAINRLAANGMYFFDYGNAFLLQSKRAGADICTADGKFRFHVHTERIVTNDVHDRSLQILHTLNARERVNNGRNVDRSRTKEGRLDMEASSAQCRRDLITHHTRTHMLVEHHNVIEDRGHRVVGVADPVDLAALDHQEEAFLFLAQHVDDVAVKSITVTSGKIMSSGGANSLRVAHIRSTPCGPEP